MISPARMKKGRAIMVTESEPCIRVRATMVGLATPPPMAMAVQMAHSSRAMAMGRPMAMPASMETIKTAIIIAGRLLPPP